MDTITVLLTALAILAGVLAMLFQERFPRIRVECRPLPDGDPSVIECVVENSGNKAAQDVCIGFTKILPTEIKVFAPPEIELKMIESENPPDPNLNPNVAVLSRAFAVHISRVAPKDSITFQVRTDDPDNRRAADQIVRIRAEIIKILQDFGERLAEVSPKEPKDWDIGALVSARIKRENLFAPGRFSYEEGRLPVAFLTEEEQHVEAMNQDLYARYKASFIDIYQGRPEFKAPVVRIKTAEGNRTYAIFPPYLKTYVDIQAQMSQLKERGVLRIYPPIPESYD